MAPVEPVVELTLGKILGNKGRAAAFAAGVPASGAEDPVAEAFAAAKPAQLEVLHACVALPLVDSVPCAVDSPRHALVEPFGSQVFPVSPCFVSSGVLLLW